MFRQCTSAAKWPQGPCEGRSRCPGAAESHGKRSSQKKKQRQDPVCGHKEEHHLGELHTKRSPLGDVSAVGNHNYLFSCSRKGGGSFCMFLAILWVSFCTEWWAEVGCGVVKACATHVSELAREATDNSETSDTGATRLADSRARRGAALAAPTVGPAQSDEQPDSGIPRGSNPCRLPSHPRTHPRRSAGPAVLPAGVARGV